MATLATYAAYVAVVLALWKPMTLNVAITLGIAGLAWGVMAFEAQSRSASDATTQRESGVFSDWKMPGTRWALMGLLVLGIVANATTL